MCVCMHAHTYTGTVRIYAWDFDWTHQFVRIQTHAFNDCVVRVQASLLPPQWLIFMDPDEFLVPKGEIDSREERVHVDEHMRREESVHIDEHTRGALDEFLVPKGEIDPREESVHADDDLGHHDSRSDRDSCVQQTSMYVRGSLVRSLRRIWDVHHTDFAAAKLSWLQFTNSGSRGDDSGSRCDDSGSRGDDSGSRGDDSGSRGDDSGSSRNDSGDKNICLKNLTFERYLEHEDRFVGYWEKDLQAGKVCMRA